MAKRSATSRKKASAAAPSHAIFGSQPAGLKASSDPRVALGQTGVKILAATMGFFLLFGSLQPWPIVLVPAFIGILSVLIARDRREALVVAAASAVLGIAAAYVFYDRGAIISAVTNLPGYTMMDVPGSLLNDQFIPMLLANAVNSASGFVGWLGLTLLAAAVSVGAVLGVLLLGQSWQPRRGAAWTLGLISTVLLALCFTYSAWSFNAPYRGLLSVEPAPETYRIDMLINLKVYYKLLAGESYYSALPAAVLDDGRIGAAGEKLSDGKVYSYWGGSPWLVRQPEAFYFWRFIAPGDGSWLLVESILASAALLIALYLVLFQTFSTRALFVPIILFPGLLLLNAWFDVTHPDWWATLFLLFAFVLALRRQWLWAAVLALAAALFREVLAVSIVAVGIAAAIDARESRRWVRDVLPAGVALVVFLGAFAAHIAAANTLVHLGAAPPGGPGFVAYYGQRLGLPFLDKNTLSAPSYLAFAYTLFRIPAIVFMPLGIVGFLVAFWKRWPLLVLTSGWIVFWLAEYVIVGPTSSYWGMHVMPLAYIGCALLPMALLGKPAAATSAEAPKRSKNVA